MRFHIVIGFLCCFALPAMAQPSAQEIAAEITDNISNEYTECGSYFGIVSAAFAKSGNNEGAMKYKEASDKALLFALIAAQQSRSKEMAEKVTLARFKNGLSTMNKTIDNNYSNISLLSSQYAERCVNAMTDSLAMTQHWTEKITAKYPRTGVKP